MAKYRYDHRPQPAKYRAELEAAMTYQDVAVEFGIPTSAQRTLISAGCLVARGAPGGILISRQSVVDYLDYLEQTLKAELEAAAAKASVSE